MKLNKIHFIEKFAIVTFPIALAVGCTSIADQENKVTQDTSHFVKQNEHNDGFAETISSSLDTSAAMVKEQKETKDNQASTMDLKISGHSPISEEKSQTVSNEGLLEAKLNLSESEENINKVKLPEKSIFHFEINKSEVAETDHLVLQQHARYLKDHPNMILYVDGFSDNRGPAHLNYQLSKKRAQQISQLLIEFGAPEPRIRVNSYGESFPLTNESYWDENRRVELEYGRLESTEELFANLN